MQKYKLGKHSAFYLAYHIVWCPKYRRPVLVGGVKDDLERMLLETAKDLGITIEKMSIMPDHVHLFVTANPVLPPHYIVGQLKGSVSFRLRNGHPQLLKLPTLWTRNYFIGTVGFVSDSVVKSYIEAQRSK
jgi:putative transposase